MRSLQDAVVKTAIVALLAGQTLVLVDCGTLVAPHRWDAKWGPRVSHENFPGECSLCHISERWDVLRDDFEWDHEEKTGYRLEGAHARALCLRCHNDRGPVQIYLARGCGGCHADPHKATLGMDCTRCHNQEVWYPSGAIADHSQTRFPLLATHALTPCESCHERATVGDFRGAQVDCHFCHQREAGRAFPNHIVNGWHRNCERCHTPASWRAQGFNHSGFPLQGGHAGLNCTDCHPGGLFVPIGQDCVNCHLNDYTNAANHVANGFSTDCTLCHNTNAWN